MWANPHTLSQGHDPFKHTAHINEYILPTRKRPTHVKARGIGQGHTSLKLTFRQLRLPESLKLRLLRATIDA